VYFYSYSAHGRFEINGGAVATDDRLSDCAFDIGRSKTVVPDSFAAHHDRRIGRKLRYFERPHERFDVRDRGIARLEFEPGKLYPGKNARYVVRGSQTNVGFERNVFAGGEEYGTR
jgi:hypothetical protein